MVLIAVVNSSSVVSNSDVALMTTAVQVQLNLHFCPAWGLSNIICKYYADPSKVPGYAALIKVIDTDANVPDALAYHTEEEYNGHDRLTGYILAKTILDNGGKVLSGAVDTVSSALSHEVLELVADRYCGFYAVGKTIQQGSFYALEVCDPVQGAGYLINIPNNTATTAFHKLGLAVNAGTTPVMVSDFVFPSFFNSMADASNAPFSYMKSVHAPFTMMAGGYMVVSDGTNFNQIFGKDVPNWKREMKQKKGSRAARRAGF